MKNWIVILLSLATVSCAYNPIYNGKEPYSGSPFLLQQKPRHTLDYFLNGLTIELLETNNYLTAKTPMAIVSFVDIEDMSESNWLGNTVTEGMIYQLQRRGFTVIDFKNTGSIRVTHKGDFTLSRNWKELNPEQNIDYVLTGTMLRQGGGILVNARIVGMRSRVVIAAAQGFLPADRIGRDLDTLRKVRIEDGVIIRGDKHKHTPETIMLKP
ncbi:FlgO family outer membrane protein [Candidatus Enterovibrio escicola]|uniref:FlgO family outer membrane protein n=1 Tax=Candidatus Enterovibrio escicola TaxID=1927127 RepID=UPI001237C491|nr:FlgO family outer membrane protein [Candidatus Enterovibrio escacola]